MKYISIGVVMAPSTEHILKVSHYGTEFTLTGDLARLWLDGRYGFANTVRFPNPEIYSKSLKIGDTVEIYVSYNAPVYEVDGYQVICNTLAIGKCP